MANSTAKLRAGTRVGFTASSGNPDQGATMTIAGHETHHGATFYRLKGKLGGLWIRSSLYAEL